MKVRALGYVGAESPEAKQWEEFGPEVLGMQVVDGERPDTVYLRMDDRHHRIAIQQGGRDRLAYLGWEIASDDDLAEGVEELERAGIAVTEGTDEQLEERHVRRLVSFTDPGGARHELYYGQLSLPNQFSPGRPIAGFVTGEQGMGHVVCVVPDLEAATRFYKLLGFKKSDEIYAFIDAHFFHCNPRHHTLAITEIPRVRGLHHIMIQLNSLDDVGLAYDIVQARDIPLTMTLGRHPNDRMVSFYVRSPSGFEIEYGWGALEVGEDWTVTQYDAVSVWGHKMVGTSPPGALEEAL
ncbi:MAG TPA: VOC family protein [Acidimicrobiia bacterium]